MSSHAVARRRRGRCLAAFAALFVLTLGSETGHAGASETLLELDLPALGQLARGAETRIEGVRLANDEIVDLTLRRFTVTTPRTRFVRGAESTPIDFDPSRVILLRGEIDGRAGSHAMLAITGHGSTGYVELSPGGAVFGLSSRGSGGRELPPGRLSVFPAAPNGGASLPVPMCNTRTGSWVPPVRSPGKPIRGLRQIEMAVETDYEYFQLFDDLTAAGDYVVALYGIVSDLFLRDANTRIDLTFVRLWDDPDDLFNGESPLSEFRDYWNDNEQGVHRDVAQFLSGRRDLGYGGVAWLEALCDDSSYSVCVFTLGRFADPERPDVFNRDIVVTAHELGHNAGTPHTHNLDIDTCDDENSMPQRGTIMSYCGQTFTGGSANMDLRFHAIVQEVLEDFIGSVDCVADDCNQNGIPDEDDIDGGGSDDANGNGIPDECEDCNGNGTLDDEDIDSGESDDLNGNGVPDECEADCDGNGVPDDLDITNGAPDANGNNIPDGCEADCNDNGMPDYDEIQADMSRDLNRNAILDECEDCDGDGTLDLDALDGAFDVWITDLNLPHARSYLARTGTFIRNSDDEGISRGHDLIVDFERGQVLVSSVSDDRVIAFDLDGNALGDLIDGGDLDKPAGLLVTPDDTLLVASNGTGEVLEYDAADGTFLGVFVSAGSGGLAQPFGLTYGPDGNLYVTSDDDRVLAYDGGTGAFLGEFVTAGDNGGLDEPRGIVFVPATGNLLVASWATNQVLEYDGATGAFIRQFNYGGTVDRLTLDQPWGLRIGPEGDVYVTRSRELLHPDHDGGPTDVRGEFLHLSNPRIYQYKAVSGWFERAYILGVDSGIDNPTGFDFIPGAAVDCNLNLIPDSCDISSGRSEDANGNGVPDECESCPADLDGSGAVDFADVLAILSAWGNPGGPEDLDDSGEVDFGDILVVLAEWGEC